MAEGYGGYEQVGRKAPAGGAHILATYVRENPLRKNLVKQPDEWPFQGRLHDIWWTGD